MTAGQACVMSERRLRRKGFGLRVLRLDVGLVEKRASREAEALPEDTACTLRSLKPEVPKSSTMVPYLYATN